MIPEQHWIVLLSMPRAPNETLWKLSGKSINERGSAINNAAAVPIQPQTLAVTISQATTRIDA